jgi:hypothetical protein
VSTVIARTAVEVVRYQPEISRASEMFRALSRSASDAGIDLQEHDAYTGSSPWLLLWGPGAPARAADLQRHVAAGGHAIALDLAYWSRDRKIRVSIDAAHPQAWLHRAPASPSRLQSDAPSVVNLWNPTGPILIAGLGPKARVQYGAGVVDAWEADMAAECGRRWPARRVTSRPKPTGVLGPAEYALQGASLVITWHSNIAVDAIRCGIPVVCRDGAAAAVCPSELPVEPVPLPVETRDRFLAQLAYFQWRPDEAGPMWTFLQELLS